MVVFAFEAVIKIIALHFRYFNDAWNIFDLIIVLFSLVDYVSQQLDGPNGFRVMRLVSSKSSILPEINLSLFTAYFPEFIHILAKDPKSSTKLANNENIT